MLILESAFTSSGMMISHGISFSNFFEAEKLSKNFVIDEARNKKKNDSKKNDKKDSSN
tara:strand:- start:117 stop:290 length:174 start_codon:yes stop_codon:yes gene_type:complete